MKDHSAGPVAGIRRARRGSSPSRWIFRLAGVLILAALAAGCAQFDLPRLILPDTPTAQPPVGVFATPTPPLQQTSVPKSTPAAQQGFILWLPPQFDPAADTEAGRLLKDRLQAFGKQEPGVKIDVRIKASSGPGGLLESLTAASAAAPDAVPSLVALSRSDLEIAALKGLVFPLDGLSKILEDADWYPYARQLGQIQGSTFGLPLGGDALLMVYRAARMGPPPADWNAILKLNQPVVFPAADPQAMFTLNLYLMLGGKIVDDQGRPMVQPDVLAKALKLYADGVQQGGFPYWLSQVQTDKQAWQAYRDQRGQWLVTWSSTYLSDPPADSTPLALPSIGSDSLTLASGWVWAVSDPRPEHRAETARLAEFLLDRDFLAKWTSALGLLPTRPSSLSSWGEAGSRPVFNQIVQSARVRPSNDLMASLGPAFEGAAMQVIKRETDASQAAQSAVDRLSIPETK